MLSFGDFSLHEQRKVTRSRDASGNAQDVVRGRDGARTANAEHAFLRDKGKISSPGASGNAQDVVRGECAASGSFGIKAFALSV